MSATTNVMDVNTKVEKKFTINAALLNLEDIKAIQKVISARKKELIVPKDVDVCKENRKALGRDIMDTVMGFNSAFNKIVKWRNGDIIVSPTSTYTLEGLGITNIDRYNYLTKKFANMIVFFPKAQGHIKPLELLERFAKICSWDDAKFATMQRSGMIARGK